MREYIQRERRVELFYEGKRPWTCRLYLEPTSKEELAKESLWKSSGSDNSKRTQKYWAANNGALPRCQRMINGMRPVQDENGAITVDGVNIEWSVSAWKNVRSLFSIICSRFARVSCRRHRPLSKIPDGKPVGMYNFKKKIR